MKLYIIPIIILTILTALSSLKVIKILFNKDNTKVLFKVKSIKYFDLYIILLSLSSIYELITGSYELNIKVLLFLICFILLISNIFLLKTPYFISSNIIQTNSGVWKIEEISSVRFKDNILIVSVPKSILSLTDQVKVKVDLNELEKIKLFFTK